MTVYGGVSDTATTGDACKYSKQVGSHIAGPDSCASDGVNVSDVTGRCC